MKSLISSAMLGRMDWLKMVRINKEKLLLYIENGVTSQTQYRRWFKWTIEACHILDGNANIILFSFQSIGKRCCMER